MDTSGAYGLTTKSRFWGEKPLLLAYSGLFWLILAYSGLFPLLLVWSVQPNQQQRGGGRSITGRALDRTFRQHTSGR